MASADLELQGAIITRLRSYAPLTATIGQNTFDNPATESNLPYVTYGEADIRRADVTCQRAQEIYVTLHAWSDPNYGTGFAQVKQIADAVSEALHEYPAILSTNRLISLDHRQTRIIREKDGVTGHGIIEFVAFVEPLE